MFTPDYFAQFSPRNALDMVSRIPGFSIDNGDGGKRGLGQASGNVIVNGVRFSSKSDSIYDQLQRIPAADVIRIEILDGTALDIPGLTGQVANVVYKTSGTSGQFKWRTGFRAYNTEAQLFGGEASLKGKSGKLGYTVSLSNENNRFGADGPTIKTDGDGNLLEEEYSKFSGKFDNPQLGVSFTYDFDADTKANLNLNYGEDFFAIDAPETGTASDGLVRLRRSTRREDGPEYEIGGDITFPLGPGTLKLIGLERFERDNFRSEVVDSFNDGRLDSGSRFNRTSEAGERIGRFEFGWKMWDAEWQVAGEAAFNRLDLRSELFSLSPAGTFVALPFPEGTGGVTEDRYEAMLSVSKPLTSKLSLQVSGGGEYSRIEQTGAAANSRTFQRPKGSLALTWKPLDDLDLSLEVERRVGQLSFGDFLANVSLNNDNQSGANNELLPFQSWDIDLEANKRLGAWGSIKLGARQAWLEDLTDMIPLPGGGEARGNLRDARRLQLDLTATIKGEPIGWKGAQLDISGAQRFMNVADPFTGLDRPFSFDTKNYLEIDFRHDIPKSNWAWGSGLFTVKKAPYSRRRETGRDYEGPVFLNLFVENKDVFGLTVNASYGNILNARNKFDRTVFDGDRPDAPILFVEKMNRRIGPIFRFSVSGNF